MKNLILFVTFKNASQKGFILSSKHSLWSKLKINTKDYTKTVACNFC